VAEHELDVEAVLGSIDIIRQGGRDPAEVFVAAGVNNVTDEELLIAIRSVLEVRADLCQTWQAWSYDKRWSPSPYLDGFEVGHYSAGEHHVRHHANVIDACADFVLSEVRWIVDCRIVGGA